MSTKRKISVRKILQTLVTLIVVAGTVFAILSASKVQDNTKLAGIDIRIKNERYGFIDKNEVKNMLLNSRHIDLAKTSIKKLDVRQMESIISANPWIANAQLYVDAKHVLHVNITQRVPVARLFERNGNSYYLDHTLKSMPLSDRYIHYTTVVTNVPELRDDSTGRALKGQIVALVQHVEKDSFWNAQVSQIIVADDTLGFELVPILGEHRIQFGDTSNMQEKFDHLFAFYTKVLNRIGWNKYQVLDLRFNGQVVASPALPWKKPKDNTMGDINWVKSLIEADIKTAESDTPRIPVQATVNALLTKAEAKPAPQAAATVQTTPPPVETKKPEVKKVEVKQATASLPPPKPEKPKTVKPAIVQPQKKQQTAPQAAKKATIAIKPEAGNKQTKTETKKQETTPKYIYQGSDNNNQQ